MRIAAFVTTAVAFISAIGSAAAFGQLVCSLGTMMPGHPYNPYYDSPPSPRAVQELSRIHSDLCPDGCGQYHLASNPTVPNAMAEAVGWGQTKISYDPEFMNQVVQQYGSGATFGILAHEFGHHIDLHTTPPWMNNRWSRELKADAWAGCALARAGIGTTELKGALQAIAAFPSPTHPGWVQRHQAVQSGFVSCGGEWLTQYKVEPRALATICDTSKGTCPILGGRMPVGSDCVCYASDGFGRPVYFPGVAR